MQAYARKFFRKSICFVLIVVLLLGVTACGIGEKSDSPTSESPTAASMTPSLPTLPLVTQPVGDKAPATSVSGVGGAMFEVVMGTPTGMGKPAQVITSELLEEEKPNHSISVIPLRAGMEIKVEGIYNLDLHFSDLVYLSMGSVTTKLGEYYQIDTYATEEPYYPYLIVRIVAQDGDEQGAFWFDPQSYEVGATYIQEPGKIPDGLRDSKMNALSGMAAGMVWQYGKELGRVDSLGLADAPITPRALALSQEFCQKWIYNIVGMIDYGYLNNAEYPVKAAQYAQVLFPGVNMNTLPRVSGLIPGDGPAFAEDPYFPWVDGKTQIHFAAPSADGQTGYVIVSISYENENGAFEDFYRVDWAAEEPFDVYRPFQYRLVGVQPLERYLLGNGMLYQHYTERYLGAQGRAELEKLGVVHDPGYLDKPGTWGAGNVLLLRTIGTGEQEGLQTYILLDDDGTEITYLGAYSTMPIESGSPENDWVDLGIIKIPPAWTYETHILDDITIEGETTDTSFSLWAGWLMADSIESVVASCRYAELFVFDDGQTGYMLFFDSYISWVREDWMSLNLNHGGDEQLYRNNEELFRKVAGSLTVTAVG